MLRVGRYTEAHIQHTSAYVSIRQHTSALLTRQMLRVGRYTVHGGRARGIGRKYFCTSEAKYFSTSKKADARESQLPQTLALLVKLAQTLALLVKLTQTLAVLVKLTRESLAKPTHSQACADAC
jgi:hypothetical protein